jgi:hypothetical protein
MSKESEYLKLFDGLPVHLDRIREENPMLEITLEVLRKHGKAEKHVSEAGTIFIAPHVDGTPKTKKGMPVSE